MEKQEEGERATIEDEAKVVNSFGKEEEKGNGETASNEGKCLGKMEKQEEGERATIEDEAKVAKSFGKEEEKGNGETAYNEKKATNVNSFENVKKEEKGERTSSEDEAKVAKSFGKEEGKGNGETTSNEEKATTVKEKVEKEEEGKRTTKKEEATNIKSLEREEGELTSSEDETTTIKTLGNEREEGELSSSDTDQGLERSISGGVSDKKQLRRLNARSTTGPRTVTPKKQKENASSREQQRPRAVVDVGKDNETRTKSRIKRKVAHDKHREKASTVIDPKTSRVCHKGKKNITLVSSKVSGGKRSDIRQGSSREKLSNTQRKAGQSHKPENYDWHKRNSGRKVETHTTEAEGRRKFFTLNKTDESPTSAKHYSRTVERGHKEVTGQSKNAKEIPVINKAKRNSKPHELSREKSTSHEQATAKGPPVSNTGKASKARDTASRTRDQFDDKEKKKRANERPTQAKPAVARKRVASSDSSKDRPAKRPRVCTDDSKETSKRITQTEQPKRVLEAFTSDNVKPERGHAAFKESPEVKECHSHVLALGRGRCLVFKRRHVNQLFVRGDNVVLIAYSK